MVVDIDGSGSIGSSSNSGRMVDGRDVGRW